MKRILAEDIGIACMTLGGGRETKESEIDLSVGIILKKKNTDAVKPGDVLATVYGNDASKVEKAVSMIKTAYEISSEPVEKTPVIWKVIR